MERAVCRSRSKPAFVRWLPRASSRTIAANFSKSACFVESMGLRDEGDTAPFSVYITRDIAVQPFLLIVRTRHVVTIVNVRQDVTMSSAGCYGVSSIWPDL